MVVVRTSVLLVLASMANAAVTTQPANTRPTTTPPTSQPASLSKYYSLMKNEFMKDDDHHIMLTPPEVEEVILGIRRDAIKKKTAIDGRIAALTKAISQAEERRKTAVAAEREAKKDARSAARRETRTAIGINNRGQVVSRRKYDLIAASQKRNAERNAEAQADKAEAHEEEITQMRVDLVKLKNESAALAAVGSPNSRTIPPKLYWSGLPQDMQSQLSRVGITQNEFKEVIASIGLTESRFVAKAIELDNEIKQTDKLIDALRELFSQRMKAPNKAAANRTAAPARPPATFTPENRR